MSAPSNEKIYWALIASLVEAHGYNFSHAHGFGIQFESQREDAPITEISFLYRSDPRGSAEQVRLELEPISGSVVPPAKRGQRA